ncbi:MAG: 2-oxoglutarate dehydrogenase E1 component [Bacteroidales bacterium]|nr:2-oxoglutarate dehydrogenase E1 component [Bacteroidales bacterium]
MDSFSHLSSIDNQVIDELYEQYKQDPESVEPGWRMFFNGFEFSQNQYNNKSGRNLSMPDEFKVINLINAYRSRGHLFTETNPVRTRRKYSPTLDIENYDLSASDMQRSFEAGHELGIGKSTLAEIISHLNETYRLSIGAEYRYIRNVEIEHWLRHRMETTRNRSNFSTNEKSLILKSLSKAVLFEKFIHRKFPGQKRFSLEGAESLIPATHAIVEKGAELGVKEFIIGMSHRGRLNVLANIFKKSFQDIFSEFEGKEYEDESLLGDVKYHLGYTAKRITASGNEVMLTIAPNPSHLEAVGPVVEGISRARIEHRYNQNFDSVVPIIIHGDASIAGQGVVYEVAQMSELEGYRTGGTIHIVVNNQIGFTTNYLDSRSSTYCTDIGKTTQSPVFHVNGDDVEAVVHTMQLAMEYRNRFNKDIYVDLLCYRKYGHNEGDEPRFTQPLLYKAIEKHDNPRDIYIQKLESSNPDIAVKAPQIEKNFNDLLELHLEASRKIEKAKIYNFLEKEWRSYRKATPKDFENSPETALDKESILKLAQTIYSLPEGKKFYRKTNKMMKDRAAMVANNSLDWAMGEQLAYGSLLKEGHHVRISGQDVQRGTFSHRHAVLTIEESEEKYTPLKHIDPQQASFNIYNSSLSEYGVLGFEYGYSLATPNNLTIWEAQFGDFFNGAQIILDQYMNSGEDKWGVMNHLVLFLPHGYEGQGPEHSSARIERIMTLCAENNMQVANISTPANFFHLLRRQIKRDIRKPLIVMTPKSLLRHPMCVSPIEDFTKGGFQEVIDDQKADPAKVNRIVLCSGKIYYDLLAEKIRLKNEEVALVRVEQIYPLPEKQLTDILAKYKNAQRHLWVQEEPVNMGPWPYMHDNFEQGNLKVIARPASGSPATGSSKFHAQQQAKIISKTFLECDCHRLNEECKMICIGNQWRQFEIELKEKKNQEIQNK